MKIVLNFILIFAALFLLNACKKTEETPIPKPIANLGISYADLGVVYFSNKTENGTIYKLDYGDGIHSKYDSIQKYDSQQKRKVFQEQLGSNSYTKNGIYKVTLKVYNKLGEIDTASRTVTVTTYPLPPIADFSYQLLENGKVKLTNLSKDTFNEYWRVNLFNSDYNTINKDTSQTFYKFEFNGNYRISLTASGKLSSDTISKIITITNANKPEKASFIGTIDGNSVEWMEDGFNIKNLQGSNGEEISMYTSLYLPVQSESISITTKNILIENYDIAPKSDKLVRLQKIFTKENDSRIMETHVADIEPLSVNVYPKALWVTYKINQKTGKGLLADGVLKVRYLVWDFRND